MKTHTYRPYDEELIRIKSCILEMAGLVARQLQDIATALNREDINLAVKVVQREKEIDQYEIRVDAEVMKVLARNSPVANDLRLVVAASKIVTDLERMGDCLAKIGFLIVELNSSDEGRLNQKFLIGINQICALLNTMIEKTIVCFQSESINEAKLLFAEEQLNHHIFKEIVAHQFELLAHNPRLITATLEILHIQHALERCTKHCINIGEHLVFMLEGKDIRHPAINPG